MSKIAIITMVQRTDLPHALTSLASFRELDGDYLRLVLLNDDADAAIVQTLADASGGEVISPGRNMGVAGGRNVLIKEATRRGAKFILSLDDDVIVPPDFAKLLQDAYRTLADAGCKPGVLTPATLDFHTVGSAIYSESQVAAITRGDFVETPATPELRAALAERRRRRPGDIYHMGVVDWRGAYFYSDAPGDRALQRIYGVEPERLSGATAHLRHADGAWTWIVEGADPLPIDTAPGGVSFYSTAMAEAIEFHDESFNPFGFEDADFALRARKSGFQHFCAPRAIAIHDIAARLSERSLAVVRATQGKMAGAFARKHASGPEAACALAAITRRAVDQVTLHDKARRDAGARLKSPARLAALAAYLGNALFFLLRPEQAPRLSPRQLLERARSILRVAIPNAGALAQDNGGETFAWRGDSLEVEAAVVADDDASVLRISLKNASIDRAVQPPLLEACAGGRGLRFDLDLTLRMEDGEQITLDALSFKAPGAASITGSARFRRGSSETGWVAPILVDAAVFEVCDDGALARVLRVLAEFERKSAADFVARLSRAAEPGVAAWIGGKSTTLKLDITGTIDGAPGPLNLSVGATCGDEPENPSVQALWRDDEEPIASAAEATTETRRSMSVMLKSLVKKVVSDDPAVTPFPEAYRPSKALRLARRARYYSAARGMALTPNEARILAFHNRHRGERAFIIGNGPSLNRLDLTKLKAEITFGVNAIYLNREKMGFLPTHHVVEDVFVAEDRAAEINALTGPNKWYGHYLRYCLRETPGVRWLNVACDYRNYLGFPHFSTNAARIVWVGGTVSYIALQLAYYMGFGEVYLVGFDHSYSIPKEAKVDGRAITSTTDDPNHFHPDYFGKGYRWHDPRVDRMEKAYVNARRAFEAAGRRIVNATAGGNLEVFDRADYDVLFGSSGGRAA